MPKMNEEQKKEIDESTRKEVQKVMDIAQLAFEIALKRISEEAKDKSKPKWLRLSNIVAYCDELIAASHKNGE